MMILIHFLPLFLTKLDELHKNCDGDMRQMPCLCTKSSRQDRTGNPSSKEIDLRLTRNDHFRPAAGASPCPNPWTPKPKREPSSESFREKQIKQGQARNPKANCRQAHCNFMMCVYTCVALERSGAICNDLERSGATWSDPDRSGAVRIDLERSGMIWSNLE